MWITLDGAATLCATQEIPIGIGRTPEEAKADAVRDLSDVLQRLQNVVREPQGVEGEDYATR